MAECATLENAPLSISSATVSRRVLSCLTLLALGSVRTCKIWGGIKQIEMLGEEQNSEITTAPLQQFET